LRERDDFFDTRRVRYVADHFLIRAGADLLLDGEAQGLKVEARLLEDTGGYPLPQFD
jgi:hypothetical protein